MASATTSNNTSQILPTINLLCMLPEPKTAFLQAVDKHFPTLRHHTTIEIHESSLKALPQETTFDAVVSPANSYARLDGAFDDALARAYGPKDDYSWITRQAQEVVYEKWKGFAPPGTCTIVDLTTGSDGIPRNQQPWKTRYLLLCPTMRIPQPVSWDREVCYECIWSLLNAIFNHNRDAQNNNNNEEEKIKTTGAGAVSNKRWAEQTVLAMRHFVESVQDPETWSRLQWRKALEDFREMEGTYSKGSASTSG
ncbi:hypothetical protein LTR78_006488 [Recurvomyces mirabilis]|uniref:Macro-like domain-containing protein n=1 Tax=Recurvomyces mirabilis TaxID=574656 RepID=A0AAE1BZY2_9PEZI|nr:hypothetical protein LTR78_006488 [Recurvomyces mirabilis]KAK5151094.1 hypothetical protein LTS14_009589 [Recurvomyces mirabilis]